MQSTINQTARRAPAAAHNLQFPPLELETRSHVVTDAAAY